MSHPKPNVTDDAKPLGGPSGLRSGSPSDLPSDLIDQIDRYQLVSRLGKGGMAEVFRAKLTSIGGFERDVAVKVLLPSYASEPEFVEMLLDEARIAGSLTHPNVLQVLDVGRKGEVFYLVMEYVDGKDLRTIAKQIPGGRIPLGMSLFVIAEVVRGLEAVHDAVDERGAPRNIIHRDISPGNVMVDRRGYVKLGDFGIAHASGRITRTRVGAVKGKSRYMAPEQLSGHPVDQRADLYAVGVTLFETLLGDFARDSSKPTVYGPMFTWPERMPQGAMPPDVEAILRRAITERAEDRYRDATELRTDLEVALHRWAPGYGPDVLSRELQRLLGEATSGASAGDNRPAAPGGVALRAPRFRGAATAEHSVVPSGDRTPLQTPPGFERESEATLRAAATLLPGMATRDDLLRPASATLLPGVSSGTPKAAAGQTLPPGEPSREPVTGGALRTLLRPRLNPRVTAALIVAAVALVLIGVAALVASSGSPPPMPVEEPPVAAVPEPRTVPLPASGTLEILGPIGASVQIGHMNYPSVPTRIELAPGEYLVRLRVGRKRRLVTEAVTIRAGETSTLR